MRSLLRGHYNTDRLSERTGASSVLAWGSQSPKCWSEVLEPLTPQPAVQFLSQSQQPKFLISTGDSGESRPKI